ncbi:hypothetical protein [Streptomyces phaeochromogenes]|uniref:hypothetical protein n=1 Tax=Streptomyces phaeochromogenes TaxID=1923 RepID=UPI0006E32C65|nr:hypothetical protein [Streptomyces phaeochromogenes]
MSPNSHIVVIPGSFELRHHVERVAAMTIELLVRIVDLLQEHEAEFGESDAAGELQCLWAELEQLEPQQDVLERALERLGTIVYPVPELTGAVRLLASWVHGLMEHGLG